MQKEYSLELTTQGPSYPPSEVMDEDGNFIVIGNINIANSQHIVEKKWGGAIVSQKSPIPPFGQNFPYEIIEEFDVLNIPDHIANKILHTLPLPLPCNNYPMVFAPEQKPAISGYHSSLPFHKAYIPDLKLEHGRKITSSISLNDWVKAKGSLNLSLINNGSDALFEFEFSNLIPDSLYTIMSLREHDLDPNGPTKPGPLGVPNVFITAMDGSARYRAVMPNPFPKRDNDYTNRIINVVVLWMSTQMSYGGAIGHYGLGGDIHAQLKLKSPSFFEFITS